LIPIKETGKQMLLYKLVHRLSEELQLFRGSELQSGFIERLNNMLTEWKRYGVTAAQITELARDKEFSGKEIISKKLHDLSLLYSMMERELVSKYVDAEDYLSMLIEGLPAATSMKGCKIWVDGF